MYNVTNATFNHDIPAYSETVNKKKHLLTQ